MAQGQVPIWKDLGSCPWWWPRIIQMEARIEGLRKTALYDPDELEPPRDLWPLNRSEELELWLKGREDVRKSRSEKTGTDDGRR